MSKAVRLSGRPFPCPAPLRGFRFANARNVPSLIHRNRGDGMAETQPATEELFGHPRGLTVLATTEMWERFSFYGMQALLMLYMTKYLLLPAHARGVLGLAGFRHGLSTLFGPMDDIAFAAQTFGIYSGLLYGTPLIGAWLGDRVLGKTRTIIIGCLLMSAGHLCMALEKMFVVALLLIVVGAGGVVGNMAAQVGLLYAPDDARRTRAFGIYLITLNIGALVSPLIIGTLGEKVGWHYGFAAAGVGMLIGLVTYLAGRRHLPPDTLKSRSEPAPPLTRHEWRQAGGILLLLIPYILYSLAANQAYGIMFIWADTGVDRHIFGWEAPVTWILIADGLLTILGIFLATRIWIALARRGREPGDFTKISVGYGGVTLAYLLVAALALMAKTPLLLWIGFFVVLDFSYGWSEPPLQSLISRDAPPSINAMMMALMKASGMPSYFIAGWMGRFYEPLGPARFWAVNASVALAAMLLVLLGRRRLKAMMQPAPA